MVVSVFKRHSESIKFESDYYELTVPSRQLQNLGYLVFERVGSDQYNFVYNWIHPKAKATPNKVDGFPASEIDDITPIERANLTKAVIKFIESDVSGWKTLSEVNIEHVKEMR